MPSAYTVAMADTTIRVSAEVRDRLATLAREQGTTIRDLLTDLAGARLTREERDARTAAATAYIREHLVPDFGDEDVEAGRQMWRDLEAGRLKAIG